MRTLIAWTLTLTVGASAIGTASAQAPAAPKRGTAPGPAGPRATAPAKAAPAPSDPAAIKTQQLAAEKGQQEMNDLLAEWEKQSKKVTSLDVGFERVDKMGAAWGNVYYHGRAMLKSPDLACLEFRKYKVGEDGQPSKPLQLEKEPNERIVCTGKEVLQYEWDEKVIYVYPLEKEVRQKALQQGPLPFLFNMNAADARRRYGMTLLKEDDKEYTISIVPREEIDRSSFTRAFLWLNKQTFLPNTLQLYPVGQKELQEFKFDAIQPNKPMDEGMFAPATKIAGWKVIYNPGGDGAKAAQAPATAAGAGTVRAPQAQAPPRRQAQQPAIRTGTNPR